MGALAIALRCGTEVRTKRALLLLVLGICVVLLIYWLRVFIAVDRCLDSGGRWNPERQSCECVEGAAPDSVPRQTCF